MKILHYLIVPTDERFTVLSDAIIAARGEIGVAAIFSTGQKVLLRTNISIEEFHRVAKEHRDLVRMRYAGKRGPWYEVDVWQV